MFFRRTMGLIATTGLTLLFVLVPLILTPWNYELFEFNKMVLTYGLAVIIVGSWLVAMVQDRKIAIPRAPLLVPLGVFAASQLLSTLYSIDPHVSWFGYYSRFNGGMLSVITYATLAIAALSILTQTGKQPDTQKEFRFPPIVNAALLTACIIAIYGVLERMGIDKHLWLQDVQSRVFSSLGQPNWFAAYLVALIPIALALAGIRAVQASRLRSVTYALPAMLSFLFFITLLFTRSRSGYIGLVIADAILIGTIILKRTSLGQFIRPLAFIHAAFFIAVFINGTHVAAIDRYVTFNGLVSTLSSRNAPKDIAPPQPTAGTLLEYGGTESGEIRTYVWQAAINAWRATPKNMAIGTGTETFAWSFFQYRPVGHNMTSEWDFLYNKAHNEYLNYLATTGIIGLAAYLALIGAMGYMLLIPVLKSSDPQRTLFHAGMLAGWSSILATNFFGFSVVVIQLFLFLFPVISWSIWQRHGAAEKHRHSSYELPIPEKAVIPLQIIVLLTMAAGIIAVASYWYGDLLFAQGYRANRAGRPVTAATALEHAIELNPSEPFYRDEYANALSGLAVLAAKENDASAAGQLAKQAIEENERALTISPKNVSFWKTRTKVLYALSEFNPALLDPAIESLKVARSLSPNDPKLLYNIAVLYNYKEEPDTSIELLLKAKELKPNYRDSYLALSAFYEAYGNSASAAAEIESYLTNVDPNDEEFLRKRDGAKR